MIAWTANFLRDLRLGARNLIQTRSLTAIALGSLALGIGGSTAMYSVIYGVILDPFPYKDVDRLVSVNIVDPARGGNGSYYAIDPFLSIAEGNTVFQGVVASTWSDVIWTGAGDPQRLRGNHCTMNTFDVMGVPPLLGRATSSADEVAGAEPVTLLGYKFWQRQFNGDPSVLGRKLTLNGKVRTIIGVMPKRFMWRGADVYLPDVFHRGQTVEGVREVGLLGRLKPGVTIVRAQSALRPLFEDLQRQRPDDFPPKWRLRIDTFKETYPSSITDALWILFGAVGLLLLIACVNVSNLLLSRAAYRQKEIAIRAALGASRWRIVNQLLAESLVLGVAGGLLGAGAAYAGLRGIIAMTPPNTIPDEAQIAVNGSVLLFTLAVSVGAALLFGLAPAVQLSAGDVASPLKEAGRGISGSLRQRLLRNSLVAGEVALSLMLLVGASLMVRTLISIQGANLGLDPARVLTVRIPLSRERYPAAARRVAFLQEVLRRVKSVPGVAAATINTGRPPVYNWSMPVEVPGNSQQHQDSVIIDQTDEDYLAAMHVPLLRGRYFTQQDLFARSHSAVVNQAFVRRYFSGSDPLGRLVRLPEMKTPPVNLADDSFQIVGVVRDTLNRISTRETLPEIYLPYTLAGLADRIYVLAYGSPVPLQKAVAAQVYAVDRDQPVTELGVLETVLSDDVYARPRFNLLLFAIFAALGLVLALFGVYGVISNSVAQRRREIGIRIALGAGLSEVIAMVMSSGAKVVGAGIAIGLAGSLASVRVLSGLVRNVSTFDPYSFVAVAVLLFGSAMFASFLPARKAARVDPVKALREE